MDAQLQTQYYMLLGLLEEAGPAVKGLYDRHMEALQGIMTNVKENEGGKGSDSYAALVIALQIFLIKEIG